MYKEIKVNMDTATSKNVIMPVKKKKIADPS